MVEALHSAGVKDVQNLSSLSGKAFDSFSSCQSPKVNVLPFLSHQNLTFLAFKDHLKIYFVFPNKTFIIYLHKKTLLCLHEKL